MEWICLAIAGSALTVICAIKVREPVETDICEVEDVEICALAVLKKTLCIFSRLNNPIRNLCKDIGIDNFEILLKEGYYHYTTWDIWEGDMRYRLKDSFSVPPFNSKTWSISKGPDDRTKYVWCKLKTGGVLPLRYIDNKWRDVGYQCTNENEHDVTHWRLIKEP